MKILNSSWNVTKTLLQRKKTEDPRSFWLLKMQKKATTKSTSFKKVRPLLSCTDPAQQTTVIHQQITSDVHEINDILVDTFQNIYNKQDDLKSSEKDIIDFLNCDNDTRPYEELKRWRWQKNYKKNVCPPKQPKFGAL